MRVRHAVIIQAFRCAPAWNVAFQMKRRIVIALMVLLACSAAGTVMAVTYIQDAIGELRRVAELHRISAVRQQLVISVLRMNTALTESPDAVTDNLSELKRSAASCTGCHHTPELASRLRAFQDLVGAYETALSRYMTAFARRERVEPLKSESAALAAELLRMSEGMVSEAADVTNDRAAEAMSRFDNARGVLTIIIGVTFVVGIAVALYLARAITRPVEQLVRATRAIAAGELGFAIDVKPGTEFGELAAHFNSMSAALRDGYAALQSEIEERKRAEARLLHDALHDALTDLPNRALFVDRVQHVIDSGKRHPDQIYAVLFLDLDRFKVVNDTLGHLVGDHLLVTVAERLLECLRPGDTVARLGGDEFGILLERIGGAPDALQVAERIQKAFSHVEVDGHELFVTASIGVTLRSERYQGPEQVLRDADIAMYQAKLKGKACAEVFDAEMHGTLLDRLQLEADLRRAAEHGGEFILHYQPIVALETMKLVGVEALVRWDKPGRGLLDASDFMPLAEESGAIIAIGEWAMRSACAQVREWKERLPALADVTLTVNVSSRQFRRPDCVEVLLRIVRDAGVDPHRVAVDVREGVIMDDVEASAAKLARLREAGIHIHIDDFGTGYSSLSYLHRFPITAVKIDRSFVSGLPGQLESEEVIRAIVSIAESLDFDVIAEGVEAEAQVRKLQELRCAYGQGFLLAKPLSGSELEAWATSARPRSVA